MTSLADKAILSGADNRPPMLEKDVYDSWKSKMELYMLNRQHGRMILELVENDPLLWPTVEEDGVTRLNKYSELSAVEAIQADCDVKATNIILQGLPSEVYALVSTHKTMPPRMTTQSAGRKTAAPRGGRTGGQTGRGAGRTGEPTSRVGGQTGDQDSQGGDKDYDGKGGAIVYTCSIEKMELVQDMSGCEGNQKEFVQTNKMQKLETKFWCHTMVGAGHVAYTDRLHKLARLVPHLVTHENKNIERYIYGLAPNIRAMVAATEPTTIQSAVLKAGMLTDDTIRNGSLKKNTEKRRNGVELSMNENVRVNNKRSRTGRAYATITNPIRKEYTGHFTRDFRARPRMVTLVKPSSKTRRKPLKQPMAIEGGQGHGKNGNQARGGAFMMGVEEARQDPNIMTGALTLNNHYATTLFDLAVDYSFVSTTFIPLLDIEPNDLSFSYDIEIANMQLVEINKVIRDCKLEIEGHTFNIDLIPFRNESFDVIVRMDWLSWHKARIVCHEKVVRISLPHGEILRVLGEKPEEKVRHLMSAKTKEHKLKDIVIVRSFPKVFPDLSRLPPSREFKFPIDLIPEAMPVAKSPYLLAPSEMKELSSQLRELQDKGFI
nr:hypothetical protein [Tanacetum cinerariifolium]